MFAMLQPYLIFLSLFVSPILLPMEPEKNPEIKTYHGVTTKRLDDVFKAAPLRARCIVKHLQDPHYLDCPDYRAAFFYGKPGCGKSTLAKAIAYKAGAEWCLIFKASTDFQGKHRGETACELRDYLEEVINLRSKTILVIDEINHLLDHANSKKHDTDATSKALWTFLDKQAGNENFFLIGTMNNIEKIPEQIKSRFLGRCIELEPTNTFTQKKETFVNTLEDATTKLHAECNDPFLQLFLNPLNDWVARDFVEFSFLAKSILREEDENSAVKIIRKKHLEKALQEIEKTKTSVKYNKTDETEEERQERHFVQGQWVHYLISNFTSPQQGLMQGALEAISKVLTGKQKQIIQDIKNENNPTVQNNTNNNVNNNNNNANATNNSVCTIQ